MLDDLAHATRVPQQGGRTYKPDGITDVDIPDGTLMRSGVTGPNFGFEGGGIQYQLKQRANFINARILQLFQSIFSSPARFNTTEGEAPIEPAAPIEPIEPIEPIL